MTALARVGRRVLGNRLLRRLALASAALRGHGLVLVFHRITADADPSSGLLPALPKGLFRRHVEALLEIGDVVRLEELLEPATQRRRPRFVLTFDDDFASHQRHALPVLRSLEVTATFFLSGRTLHGLEPLWFERLESHMVRQGVGTTARWLGIDTDDPVQLATACENDLELQQRVNTLPVDGIERLDRIGIRALADAGMSIGFHTLHHVLLRLLGDRALDEALTNGRAQLEEASGRPVRCFAYPHGKPDPRSGERLRHHGFVAACTGRPTYVGPGDDPYLIGRWEPGALEVDEFISRATAKLNVRRAGA
jgi:peptidoglycan/xylan/chitin deacetylase (PgdA/CDA1 family)